MNIFDFFNLKSFSQPNIKQNSSPYAEKCKSKYKTNHVKKQKKITKIFNVLQKHDFLFFFLQKEFRMQKKKQTGDLFLHHTKTSRLFVWFSLTQNLFYFVTKKSFFLLSFLKNIEQNIIFDQNSNEKFMISRVKIGFFIFTISNQWDKITTFFFF